MSYLQEKANQLGNPSLSNWGMMAERHWREFLPKLYRSLEESGDLEAALVVAQETAKQEYADLVLEGMSPDQAREIVLAEYILRTPEAEQEEQAREDREANEEAAMVVSRLIANQ